MNLFNIGFLLKSTVEETKVVVFITKKEQPARATLS